MSVPPLARIGVGVLVERRRATNPWDDFLWKPVSVLVGEPAAEPWTQLGRAGEVVTFYAGAADIELFRSETGHYRENLATQTPSLWVALRPCDGDPPYRLMGVTADPAEGESFTQVGENVVEAVPMPAAVCEAIAAFVAEHHVERPFVKRQRDRKTPGMVERHVPIAKDRAR
jgi:hypothetical protein